MSVACLPIPHSGFIERDRLAVRQETRLLAVIWTAVLGLGLVRTWASRYTVNADGISYMDMAIAIAEGRWAEAINGYWSPAYPVLLGCVFRVLHPSPAYEAAVAHGVNFIIFALACASFHFLWSGLMRSRDESVRRSECPTDKVRDSLGGRSSGPRQLVAVPPPPARRMRQQVDAVPWKEGGPPILSRTPPDGLMVMTLGKPASS